MSIIINGSTTLAAPTLVGPVNYLLDNYAGASAAYSTRKLRTSYTGAALRVRRSSDNTQQDIGFNSNNELDTVSLLSFVGTDTGFVTIWYDQSVNGRNLIQNTTSSQPRIVATGGNLYIQNNKPSLRYLGSSFLQNTANLDILKNVGYAHSFIVSQYTNVPSTTQTLFNFSISTSTQVRYALAAGTTSSKLSLSGRRLDADSGLGITSSSNVTTNLQLYTGFVSYANSDAYLYINGIQEASNTSFFVDGNTSNTNSQIWIVGAQTTTTNFINGHISEFIIYTTDQSENRTGIESYINQYYNIY